MKLKTEKQQREKSRFFASSKMDRKKERRQITNIRNEMVITEDLADVKRRKRSTMNSTHKLDRVDKVQYEIDI